MKFQREIIAEGKRQKVEGRRNNSKGLDDLEFPNRLGDCYITSQILRANNL
ncbi:MAG: hypothetical protein HC849_01030 [Oscillatoriales cyanobacterium RU_3_3]|nr:hypothetical protein [Microcoleus sp. SU_5_6]NJL66940.1 hypothetical protein [Microcoleus sp. SM1_3_4]NJM59091.1 hypothetical protein [Oscillatoriales cyanobacterium RU_3_3]NJR21539.1 hypothetical protein [Richelia sp. CSU_2_1]